MDAATVLIVVLALLLCFLLRVQTRQNHRLPPGPIGNFICGHALRPWFTQQFLTKYAREFGGIFHIRIFTYKIVIVSTYEAIKEALNCDALTGRIMTPYIAEMTCNGSGLVLSEGQLWKEHRRFSLSVLRDFGLGKCRIETTIQDELEHLRDEVTAQRGRPFSPHQMFAKAVSNVINALVFSERCAEDPEFGNIADDIRKIVVTNQQAAFFSAFWPVIKRLPFDVKNLKDTLYKRGKIIDFLLKKVNEHKKIFDKSNIRDFVDAFLLQMDYENNSTAFKSFTETQLCQAVFDLFLAGTETTSSTLQWAMICLVRHPEVQKKVHDEIDRTIGSSKLPDTSDRSKMRYIDAVVHEVGRFTTLVPFAIPHRATEDVQVCGYDVPKDSIVIPNIEFTHRTGRWWKSPDRFDPENFLDADGNLINTQYMLAFSTGKRVCLGETLARQELFIFLTGLLQRFEFAEDADHPLPGLDDYEPTGVVRAPRIFHIIAKPRNTDC